MTLTAPSNKDAKNLFKWPNNFAWTYNGDLADSSIKDKVQAAGGKVNGYLRCSLAWYNGDDLDIHIIQPRDNEIYYSHRTGASGGVLDVDMNAGGIHSRKPVENVIWEDEPRMEGMYMYTISAKEIITMLDLLLKLNVTEKYVSIPTQQIFEVIIK